MKDGRHVLDVYKRQDQEGGEAIKGEGEKPIYAIQPSILRHKDGRLQVLCRTRNAQIATSWSSDNGETWSKVTLLDVPNNNSGTDAVTMKDEMCIRDSLIRFLLLVTPSYV